MNQLDAMLAAALAARARAHAPYSGFQVGAAVRGASGTLYTGCNVENAAYPQGWCAETTAIAHLVMAGESAVIEVLVVAAGEYLCTPCGGCRQKLAEFAGADVPVHVADEQGVRRTFTLGELLPAAFGPENLE